jgi:flavin reductase (DIM6/NTAB) family NADH-FMN oxidoreductase RutF
VDERALLTVGTEKRFNMMTIAGVMCGKFFLKPMMQIYVHPERYTYQFLAVNDYLVSFFDVPRHPALQVYGSRHGNECNKAAVAGLHPVPFEHTLLSEEAKTIFVCKKAYHTDVEKNNFDSQGLLQEYYKGSASYHRIFIGQIEKVLTRNKV